MEIKFENVSYKQLNNITISFKNNEITSLISEDISKNNILELIYFMDNIKGGNIKILNYNIDSKLDNKKKSKIRNDIAYLGNDFNLFNINILEDIKFANSKVDLEYLNELLELFKLNSNILKKNHLELSSSEKMKISLISLILKDSKIIILNNPTRSLDKKSIESLIKILKRKKKDKIILISSMDSNFMFSISDKIIAVSNNKIKAFDNKYDAFEDEKLINSLKLEVPNILKFKKEALKLKNVKLARTDNINDLIKDIYRNAK